MKKDLITSLFDYTFWAYARVWDCTNLLSDDQFTMEADYSIGSVRNQLLHVVSASSRWMNRLTGSEPGPRLVFDEYRTKTAAREKWDEIQRSILKDVYSLSDATLDEPVKWSLLDRGITSENPRWQILIHLANHATDHRSQILTLLGSQFHVPTFEQDMIFYFANKPA